MKITDSIKRNLPMGGNKNFILSVLSLIILLLYVIMASLPDLKLYVPELISLSALVIILISLIPVIDGQKQSGLSPWFILIMAVILRLLFLFHSPELSDDIFRYVFDGNMTLLGNNPYASAPSNFQTDNLELLLLKKSINHSNLITIYPPAAQLTFSAGAFIGGVIGMKLMFIILDIFSCIFILILLKKLKLPISNSLLYAWHPLTVIETAASGHMDGAVIFFTVLTFLILLSGKKSKTAVPATVSIPPWFTGFVSGITFSMAVLSKWTPLIFAPGILLITAPKKLNFMLAGFIISFSALFVFFWPEVTNSFNTLLIYASNWEFSGFIFRTLRSLTGSGDIARYIIMVLFISSVIAIYLPYIKKSPTPYSIKPKKILQCFYFTSMAFILLTPTLHPWYLLYMTVFLPFTTGPSGIIFSWSIFLAYRVVMVYGITGKWTEDNLLPFLIFIAPVSAFLVKSAFCYQHRCNIFYRWSKYLDRTRYGKSNSS